MGRLSARLALLVLVAALVASCGAAPPSTQPRAQVQFIIEPENARVYVDERFVGAARVLARRPPSFAPGPRQFSVTADGHFPHDVSVDLPSGITTIRLRLRPIPP